MDLRPLDQPAVSGIAEASQIFFRDPHVLPKLLSYEEWQEVTGGKPIAVWSQSISGVKAINPLVAFYDIHGRERCYSFILSRTPHETREVYNLIKIIWSILSIISSILMCAFIDVCFYLFIYCLDPAGSAWDAVQLGGVPAFPHALHTSVPHGIYLSHSVSCCLEICRDQVSIL
jgi:hypothetical protein